MNMQPGISANNVKNVFINIKNHMKQTIAHFAKVDSPMGVPRKMNRSSRVAPIHEQEARQRYWILRRDIEMSIDSYLTKLGGKADERQNIRAKSSIDAYISELKASISKKLRKKPHFKSSAEKALKLLGYYKILLIYKNVDSNRLGYLSMLWKDLTFIRTRMLSEGIIDADKLVYQLDFCRSEAEHIGAQDDPEIKSMMTQAAKNLGLGNSRDKNDQQATRLIVSLMAKLNDMRIRRLTDQVHKKKTYMALFSILIVLSLLVFSLNDYLIADAKGVPDAREGFYAIQLDTIEIQPNDSRHSGNLFASVWNLGVSVCQMLINAIVAKPTIFIFFAGLAGGFFSALMKFEPNKQLPGDDIYIRWYRLTKPFIGAFGATVIFIIVTTGLFQIEFIGEELLKEMSRNPVSGIGFTFGFLTGFTERLILPKMN